MNYYFIPPTSIAELAKLDPAVCQGITLDVPEWGPFYDSLVRTIMWPVAANPRQIIVSLDDQKRRAATVVRAYLQLPRIRDKKLLDFGCGTGSIGRAAAILGAAEAIGFDLHETDEWKTSQARLTLTTDWNVVRERGPYQTVLLYDVLDHVAPAPGALELEPHLEATAAGPAINGIAAALLKLKEVAPAAEYVVRCHPWLSKHGTHLYLTLNKAYAHLFLDEQLIADLGGIQTPTLPLRFPLASYAQAFARAGFRINSMEVTRNKLDPFFDNDYFKHRLLKSFYGDTPMTATNVPELLSFEYVDYVLTPFPHG